MKRGHILTI